MGRHEIRLQRKRMTSRRIESHKNYHALLKKHKRSGSGKKLLKIAIYIIIVTGIIALAYYGLQRLERNREGMPPENSRTLFIKHSKKSQGGMYKINVSLKYQYHGKA